jgi:hypothetical protein
MTDEADAIRRIERARLAALVAGDVTEARMHHAPDFQLITPIGAVFSRDEYMDAVGSGHLRYLAWEPEDIAVRLHGDVAVIRYRARIEVVFGRQKVPPGECWHTDTYERRNGHWMAVWSQATAIG